MFLFSYLMTQIWWEWKLYGNTGADSAQSNETTMGLQGSRTTEKYQRSSSGRTEIVECKFIFGWVICFEINLKLFYLSRMWIFVFWFTTHMEKDLWRRANCRRTPIFKWLYNWPTTETMESSHWPTKLLWPVCSEKAVQKQWDRVQLSRRRG